jgi:hypothetical protein
MRSRGLLPSAKLDMSGAAGGAEKFLSPRAGMELHSPFAHGFTSAFRPGVFIVMSLAKLNICSSLQFCVKL